MLCFALAAARICASRIKKLGTFALLVMLASSVQPSIADFTVQGHGFPGKGNYQDWQNSLPIISQGESFGSAGRYDEAISKYKEAIRMYPYLPDPYIDMGVAQHKKGDLQGAVGSLKAGLALDPNDWTGWNDLAGVYFDLHDRANCLQAARRALELAPESEKQKLQHALEVVQSQS